jgi:F0F1-type ATP synthase membrane subunit c/vacuolar-type H+-ATPase subunit K
MNKNPYRKAAQIAAKVGNGIMWAICGLTVAAFIFGLVVWCLSEGWGWWTLLLIPGIPAVLALIGLFVALFWWVQGTVSDAWRNAERGWDTRQASSRSGSES